LAMLKGIGEANVAVTMEIKSIDFDSYLKITEVAGLREIITSVAGVFMAEMIMGEIDPKIGVWHKTPATPETIKEMERMTEKIDPLMDVVVKSSPDILFVKRVLPNTKVNDIAVYNFTAGIDLDKTKNLVIALIPLIGEMMEKDEVAVTEVKQKITENWPKVTTAIEATEIDASTYICREIRFAIKEARTVNVSLYRIIAALEPMIIEDMTPEELAEFNEQKEAIRNINFAIAVSFIYSDHNAVPAIRPPAEYEVVETGNGMF